MTDTPLSDDVVERSAKAIEATTGYSGDIARRQARAALEAARYGEMEQRVRELEEMLRQTGRVLMGWETGIPALREANKRIVVLLSSIGASHDR